MTRKAGEDLGQNRSRLDMRVNLTTVLSLYLELDVGIASHRVCIFWPQIHEPTYIA